MQKRILIADDEKWYTEPLKDGLEPEGYIVTQVTYGEDCLNELGRNKYALLVLDVMMDPGPNLRNEFTSRTAGLEVTKRIRNKDDNLPIIIVSVVTDKNITNQFKELNVSYLRKGETPLRKILGFIRGSVTGIAYSTESEA